MDQNNNILVVVDMSYFNYYVLYGAVSRFMQNYKFEAESLIKKPEDTDQEHLPSLLVSNDFKKELKDTLIKRCESIDFILKNNFQDELDAANRIDFIFAMDDRVSNSFRKDIYPEYKATRKLQKKSYSTSELQSYIVNVLFPELDLEHKYGYQIVKVDGAEGDDVVACVMKNFNDYNLKVLIASDHDFCQLENVRQFDLMGKEILPVVKIKGEKINVDSKTALLMKIIQGDGSDNIPAIGERIGPVAAYRYATDTEKLKTFLVENQDAAKQFELNKKIISFNNIPVELSDKIVENVGTILKNRRMPVEMDLSMQNLMEL